MNAATETIALPTAADVDAAAAKIKGVAIQHLRHHALAGYSRMAFA